jgi:hypothetical protein
LSSVPKPGKLYTFSYIPSEIQYRIGFQPVDVFLNVLTVLQDEEKGYLNMESVKFDANRAGQSAVFSSIFHSSFLIPPPAYIA